MPSFVKEIFATCTFHVQRSRFIIELSIGEGGREKIAVFWDIFRSSASTVRRDKSISLSMEFLKRRLREMILRKLENTLSLGLQVCSETWIASWKQRQKKSIANERDYITFVPFFLRFFQSIDPDYTETSREFVIRTIPRKGGRGTGRYDGRYHHLARWRTRPSSLETIC